MLDFGPIREVEERSSFRCQVSERDTYLTPETRNLFSLLSPALDTRYQHLPSSLGHSQEHGDESENADQDQYDRHRYDRCVVSKFINPCNRFEILLPKIANCRPVFPDGDNQCN